MFGVGFGEFLVIAVVLVLVVGPESMPRLMRSLARGIREFRRATRELRQQVGLDELLAEEELRELRAMRQDPLGVREAQRGLEGDVRAWMNQAEGPEPGQPVPATGAAEGEPEGEGSDPWPKPLPAAEAVPRDPRAWAPKGVREDLSARGAAPGSLPYRPGADPERPEAVAGQRAEEGGSAGAEEREEGNT